MHAGNAWASNLTIWSQVDSHCVESAPALNLSGTEQFSLLSMLSRGFFTSHGIRQVPYTLSYSLILDTVLSRLLTERNTDRHFFEAGRENLSSWPRGLILYLRSQHPWALFYPINEHESASGPDNDAIGFTSRRLFVSSLMYGTQH